MIQNPSAINGKLRGERLFNLLEKREIQVSVFLDMLFLEFKSEKSKIFDEESENMEVPDEPVSSTLGKT